MRFNYSLLVVLVAFAGLLRSQEFRSTISGRIVDSQDALVPAVKVSLTHKATGARYETVSSPGGIYTVTFLPPGVYQMAAEATGFKRYVRDNLLVSTNERLDLDITLELGQTSETVTVTADAPLLETGTASTGQVINSRQIENMPLAGRTPIVLAQLAFGVVPTNDVRSVRPFDNTNPSGFSMGGSPTRSNELLIDGLPDTNQRNEVAYNPPVDAVSEIKVETFQADAAYGHTGGGTVNMVLKGGTNGLHGSLWEFNQVSRLAATPFFTNRAGQKKVVYRFNQWGTAVGGPVVIPKVFNGRNKLFFYFAYEGVRDFQPRPVFATVPSAAERNGNLSELLAAGNSYQIYDPLTGVQEGPRVRRQPFANNTIPANRINPIARRYLDQFYPLSNGAGRIDGQDNFFANTSGEANKFHSELGRLDFNFSDRHKMFYNFRFNERFASGENPLDRGNTDVTASTGLRRTNYGTILDDVYSFSPTVVLNTRLGWNRFTEESVNFSSGYDFTTLGFPGALAGAASKRVLPRIRFDRFTGVGASGGTNNPFDIFQIFSTLTKIAGKHSLKTGADLRMIRESLINYGFASGDYLFGSNWTRGPLDNAASAPLGQDLAAFLLGLPTAGAFDVNAFRTNQAGYFALFIQNDFRLNRNLTLNLGLRYERDLPTKERFNRSLNGFDFETPNPVDAAASRAYDRSPIPEIPVGRFRSLGGPLFAGPSNRAIYKTNSHYFSPRFGFAWTPAALGTKTVLRGGTGLFFFPVGTTGVNQTGFSQTTLLVPTLDGFLTPSLTFTNPFPTGIEQPTGSTLGLATFLGRPHTFYNPNRGNAYSIRWHLSVQRQLARDLVMEAGYVGNHAVHQEINQQLDFVPRNYFSAQPSRDQVVIDRMTANVASPYAGLIPGTPLNGSTVARQQVLRPYPQFTGVTAQALNRGSSYFHMFQARLEKRFSIGLQFLANYQYSKLIESRSLLNESDLFLEKRIAAEDRPQRFVLSASYYLPFGKGRAFGSKVHPALGKVISGWIANGIFVVQPGPVLTWGNVIYNGGGLNIDPRSIDAVFDTTRFNTNPREQLDWNIRSFPSRFANLRQDGVNNFDFSILKDTGITEKANLQFRLEFFNAFNHANFTAPELSPTATNFGRVLAQANLPRRIQMALRLVW